MQFLCGVAEVQGARGHHKAPELLEGDVHEVAASRVSITPTSCRRSTLTIAASGWSRFVPAGRAGEEVSTVRITVEFLACPDILESADAGSRRTRPWVRTSLSRRWFRRASVSLRSPSRLNQRYKDKDPRR